LAPDFAPAITAGQNKLLDKHAVILIFGRIVKQWGVAFSTIPARRNKGNGSLMNADER